MSLPIEDLTPRQIVAELDLYIVGQDDAKRAVAVALRNRFRRQQLPAEDRRDIMPKNILMMGPTGVGKTEIARRLAQLARAPFVKVEATKFTEVGYVGRDVESMVRDLVANAVRLVEQEKIDEVRPIAHEAAIDQLVNLLDEDVSPPPNAFGSRVMSNPWANFPPGTEIVEEQQEEFDWEAYEQEKQARQAKLREEILRGDYDSQEVEVEIEEPQGSQFLQVFTPQGMEEMGIDMNQMMGRSGTRVGYRKMSVREAKMVLEENEAKKRIDQATIHKEALERAEQTGIIFIDEIDKVAMASGGDGPAVSREGVQRDLLPIVEGSSVASKFGTIRTDHILFVTAGAFHESKPSDLIPELQGRLPIRVQLQPLEAKDFVRILREPKNSLTTQYAKLLKVEGIDLSFTDDALVEIARFANDMNDKVGNIGARRLHTMMERLLEDYMFDAPEVADSNIVIDAQFVREELGALLRDSEAQKLV